MKFKVNKNRAPKVKPANVLEKDIQKAIMDYLTAAGIQASVTNADRTWGKGGGVRSSKVPKGHPDITAVLPVGHEGFILGLAWYIEVKTATGSTSSEQKDKLTSLAKSGALCTLARDVDTVIQLLFNAQSKLIRTITQAMEVTILGSV